MRTNKPIKVAILFFVFSLLFSFGISYLFKSHLSDLSTAGDFIGGIFGASIGITNLYLFYVLTIEISAYQNNAEEKNRTYIYKSFLFESRSKLLNDIISKTSQLSNFKLERERDNSEYLYNFQKEITYLDVAVQKMFLGVTLKLLIEQIRLLSNIIGNIEGHTQHEIDIVMLAYSQIQYETISQLTAMTYDQFPPS